MILRSTGFVDRALFLLRYDKHFSRFAFMYTGSEHDALKAHSIPAQAAGLGLNHYTGYPGSPVRATYNPRNRPGSNSVPFDADHAENLSRPYRAYHSSIFSIPGPSARARMFRAFSA